MVKRTIGVLLCLSFLLCGCSKTVTSQSQPLVQNQQNQSQQSSCNQTANVNPTGKELTQQQKDALVYMWQEEKLAKDVYTKLYEKWNLKVFNNIAGSEKQHMDSVKNLLVNYNVSISELTNEAGKFALPEMQALYDKLIAKGSISARDAIKVGIEIEELDIKDLEERIACATPDVAAVFEQLKDGSIRHLESFKRNSSN